MRENGDPLKEKHSLSDEVCEYVHSRSEGKKDQIKGESSRKEKEKNGEDDSAQEQLFRSGVRTVNSVSEWVVLLAPEEPAEGQTAGQL